MGVDSEAIVTGGGDDPAAGVAEGEDIADWVLAGLDPLVAVLGDHAPIPERRARRLRGAL
jgi:hypothetical protein